MAKQKVTTTTKKYKIRKSKGGKNCPVCGKFMKKK